MNQLSTIGLAFFTLISISGCAPTFENKRKVPEVIANKDGTYTASIGIYGTKAHKEVNEMAKDKNLYPDLHTFELYDEVRRAAEETLLQHKTHFAVINEGVNNLKGNPITSLRDMLDFCRVGSVGDMNFFRSKWECGVVRGNESLKFVMFDGPSNTYPLWDAKKTLAELK